MLKNPFVTSGYAGSEYFCDRVAETENLTKLLQNGNNVVLMSPRRLGKTGLLCHCFEQQEIKSQYNTFVIDIYSTKNLNDMVFEIGKEIVSSLKPLGKKAVERFLTMVSSLKPGISFDVMGNATWSMEPGTIHTPTYTLEQIFDYINTSRKPNIIAIDEFQQVMYYSEKNIEEILRTHIQKCRNAQFVFSGSERHMLSEMFHSPARPFYASTTTLPLEPLPMDKYQEFARDLFEKSGKHLEPDVAKFVYEKFEGVTWFMQKTMNQLFSDIDRGEECTVEMVATAIKEIIDSNSTIYADLLYQLTVRQRDLLVAINKEGKATNITGSKFIKRHNLPSPSTIQTTIKALVDKQLVTNNLGVYEVYDKFFSLWLRESNLSA